MILGIDFRKSSKNTAEAKAAGKPSRGSTTGEDDTTAKDKPAGKPSRGSISSEDDTISTQEPLSLYYFGSYQDKNRSQF